MGQWLVEQIRKKIINIHLRLLQDFRGKVPIRLTYWVGLRSLAGIIFCRPNPLFPARGSLRTFGKTLAIPELQQLLWDDILGEWALDSGAISVIWRELYHDNPRIVIECGAGISTLCLAKYALLQSTSSRPHCMIISLEQDKEIKRTVEQRLVASGINNRVEIIYAPLKVQQVCGTETWGYNIEETHLNDKLGSRKADWVLVDGPSGPAGCRLSTIPMLARFSRPGARWFLDDAFRDGELEVLRKWQHLPNIEVKGIYPIGKGLATGVIHA